MCLINFINPIPLNTFENNGKFRQEPCSPFFGPIFYVEGSTVVNTITAFRGFAFQLLLELNYFYSNAQKR